MVDDPLAWAGARAAGFNPRSREIINTLVQKLIRKWREEFCRAIKLKFESGYMLPFKETLPNYMRREVGKFARELGVDAEGGGGASGGSQSGSVDGGLDPRKVRLRANFDEGVKERETLQRLAASMRTRVAGPLKG